MRTTAVTLALLAWASPALAQDATAFVNVNVVAMDSERVLENQTVIVRGDRVVTIGPAAQVSVPSGAVRVDAAGRYLMPGLAEMHAHVPGGNASQEWVERVLFLYVSNGVTTIRGMLGDPRHLELRERIRRGEVLGPTLYTSGPSFNGNTVPTAEAARRRVEEQKAAGYNFLKIHPGVSRAAFDTLVATADRLGLRFAGHVPAQVGLARALEAKYASIDHLDGYMEAILKDGASTDSAGFFGARLAGQVDELKITEVARATREAGVWNVPTQALMESFLSPVSPEQAAQWPGVRYMPPQQVSQWETSKRNAMSQPGATAENYRRVMAIRGKLIKALHDAGAGLLLGSDAPQVFNVPGFSVHRELRLIVEAGLTPYEALVTGTRNVATYFGTADQVGTVAQGKVADLVLVDGNPLADVANASRIAGVMVRGRWLPKSEIDRRLEGYAAATN